MSPLWEWKQQLFAETTSADTSAVVVPLSTLKAVVYGEVAITTQSCHFSQLSICCYRYNLQAGPAQQCHGPWSKKKIISN
uniref:Uncharacterized protein n=1 Tax=Brassica oleracea var. oleracea TaxID=109376 RepID=A0A0D3CPC6_BRAOL